MDHLFQHPLGREILKRVGDLLKSDQSYILRDSKIVFVCGGPTKIATSMRARFLEYAKTEIPHQRMFLAEAAEKDYVSNEEPGVHDIGEFEDIIGEVSDCVVIFPESPGSYAELGYFSKNEELRKKILVVNDIDLQGQDSFILHGPIHKIDLHSKFAKTIQIAYNEHANFDLVKQRLENRITGKRRTPFAAQTYSDLSFRKTFFALFEAIRIFQVVTFTSIEFAFRSIFGNAHPTHLRQLLSILVAADLVRRRGEDHEFFCINRDAKPFMDFVGFDEIPLRLKIADLYNKDFPGIAQIVRELSDGH